MTRNVILIDLDDTVCQSWRREELITESWDAFHADLHNDEPVADIAKLLWALALRGETEDMQLIGFTARPEKYRQATIAWMVKHGICLDDLMMRPEKDFRPSPIVKVAMAAERFGGEDKIKDHVAMIIDDRADVVQAFSALGVTTLLINARRDNEKPITDAG